MCLSFGARLTPLSPRAEPLFEGPADGRVVGGEFVQFGLGLGRRVGIGLNNVQVVARGERIDGRRDAAEEFAEFAEDDSGAAPKKAASKAKAAPKITEPSGDDDPFG